VDEAVVDGFGDEWSRFDQTALDCEEREAIFDTYFSIFPWEILPANASGFDLGCGSGRWARLVAPRVGWLHCIDASGDALAVARRNLSEAPNASFHHASVDAIPLADASMDFGYSLGVLHHVPNTAAGLRACVAKLKIGAPFLLYLYYAFDGKPWWFRACWRISDILRRLISELPHSLRYAASQALAVGVYWPLARIAALAEKLGVDVSNAPLAFYRDKSLYTMRTDALDRFGTRLEQRFTKAQIADLMGSAGLSVLRFSTSAPFWCAVGIRVR
jgi:SAM-dependent methyltransferase